jgi:hypothetical protein
LTPFADRKQRVEQFIIEDIADNQGHKLKLNQGFKHNDKIDYMKECFKKIPLLGRLCPDDYKEVEKE